MAFFSYRDVSSRNGDDMSERCINPNCDKEAHQVVGYCQSHYELMAAGLRRLQGKQETYSIVRLWRGLGTGFKYAIAASLMMPCSLAWLFVSYRVIHMIFDNEHGKLEGTGSHIVFVLCYVVSTGTLIVINAFSAEELHKKYGDIS